MIEVFPEISLLDFFFQILVRGGNDSHVYINIGIPTDTGYLLFLQSSQHFGLGVEAHVTDFVEEERSPVGEFEFPFLLLDGRGERTFLMPE